MLKETITFRGYGNLGDHIYSLSGIREVCRRLNKKAIIYTALNVRASYYPGATHETVDDSGEMVMMNQKAFDFLRPLLLQQDFIEDYLVWKGQEVVVDLTRMHTEFVGMPYGNISKWPSFLFPDMASDLSKSWVDVPPIKGYEDTVIINRTARYNNPHISYFFLKDYPNVAFVGTEKEHGTFNEQWELNIPRIEVDNALELAMLIKGCKFVVGGQSFVFSLAEAQKVPRILEVCPNAPNVDPVGGKAFWFLHQKGLEYCFKELNK